MNNEQIRIAIAESEGWKFVGSPEKGILTFTPDGNELQGISYSLKMASLNLPNYPEDLNAILPLLPVGAVIHILLNKFEFSAGDFTMYIQGKSLALAACEFYLKWKGLWKED